MGNKKTLTHLAIFITALFIGAVTAYVLVDIVKHQQASSFRHYHTHPLGPLEDDPKKWGLNHPQQFESFMKTLLQTPTLYGGSMAIKNPDYPDDPREYVSRSKVEQDPRLKIIWAGYPFAVDTREKRGHAYMLIDQIHTKRQIVAQQPGACLNCHSSTYVGMMELGDGDLEAGFHKLNKMPYHEGLAHVTHALSCIDCHTPDTMKLRITRPAFEKGMAALKASQGVHGYEVNRDASHREMRSFVCAQCHVNYHFAPETRELTYPWGEGLKVENILSFYESNPHTDWRHPQTGAQLIKAQHPEFEMWSQGAHGKAGVSCVDCHMPYQREGAYKVTNHHIRSPLLNAEKACMTCHTGPVDNLLHRVTEIQTSHHEMLERALDALVSYIGLLEQRKERLDQTQLTQAQEIHRKAQFMIDFVEAENSMGFHAPQEGARLLLTAIDLLRKGTEQFLDL